MALISQPTQGPVVDAQGYFTQGYKPFFTAVFNLLVALTLSGTTANRPTSLIFAGRPYFDTDLGANGKPIWLNKNGTGWVDATGAPV